MNSRVLINSFVVDDLSVSLVHDPVIQNDDNYFSVLTGKNGVGKSRALEIMSFCIFFIELYPVHEEQFQKQFKYSKHILRTSIPFSSLSFSYYVGGILNDLTIHDDGSVSSSITVADKELHPKLICVSNSLFNRFIEGFGQSHSFPFHDPNKYKNLSLSKDVLKFGGFSDDSFINKVLGHEVIKLLFTDKVNYIRSMAFMRSFGVTENVTLVLTVNHYLAGANLDGIKDLEKFKESLKKIVPHDEEGNATVITDEMIHTTERMLKYFCGLLDEETRSHFRDDEDGMFFVMGSPFVTFSFDENTILEEGLIKDMLFLSEMRIVNVEHLTFKKGDHLVESDKMSSGELCIFLMLLRINSEIEDNTIIMIDEPEISLHPAWQKKIIPELQRCFINYKGCHFIIATHSPQVVSSLPRDNSSVAILGSDQGAIPGSIVRGKSSDYQLFATLNYPGEHNEYVIRMLTTIIAKQNIRKELSGNEIQFLDRAIKMFELNKDVFSERSENNTIEHLLKQAIGMFSM